MKARILFFAAVGIVTAAVSTSTVCGQGTAFTYQGRLTQDGVAANGTYDLRFGLYTNVSTGSFVGSLETNAATTVSNGVFTTALNFSNAFNGSAYWLDIGVRTNGSTGAFTTLTPRQPITPTPYAITASNLSGLLPASQLSGSLPASALSGAFSNSVSFTNTTNIFVGNGSGLSGVPGVTQSNYLFLYDTTVQNVGTANVYQNVTFNSAGNNSGWASVGSGAYVVTQSGLYLVQYSAHFQNGSFSATLTAALRAVLNVATLPSEIPGSESILSVPAGLYIGSVSHSFLLPMNAGQTLSLQMVGNVTGGSSGGYLVAGSFGGQAFPSISMTVTRIQ